MPKWTKEQQAAIDARGSNLLVAAAAGSGKTAVLVERILQLILKDKVQLDKLLVVTFTNAAAGEMRERIGSALTEAMENNEQAQSYMQENEHLRQQLNLLTKASISTLHSFCIRVIRKYFHVIDLDPGFRIGDETETSLLKLETIEELFESEYEKASEDFHGLVERFSDNRQDVALQELVLRLHTFIQSKPFPKVWLEERVEDFARDVHHLEGSPWSQALMSTIEMEIQGIVDLLKEALQLCQKPNGPYVYEENLLDDLSQINDILMPAVDQGLQALCDVHREIKFSRLKNCKKDVDEDLKKRTRDLRDNAKTILADLGGGLLAKGLEQSVDHLNELYPYMKYLCELVLRFGTLFGKKKQEKGMIDFNDLEHYALDILQHEQVAEELQEAYDHVFIDEYQDSNLVQETILSYICKEDNLFMVGDVKQSIYRFRLADPSIFLEKYGTYLPEEGQLNRRIDLNQNFRSHPNLLMGVNYLFENLMSTRFGEMDYDDKAALYPGLETPPTEIPDIELHLVEKIVAEATDEGREQGQDQEQEPGQGQVQRYHRGSGRGSEGEPDQGQDNQEQDQDQELDDLSDMEVEAVIAAERILKLVGTEIYDAKKQIIRKADFSDMVVLLRSTKMAAPIYQEVFTAKGIPVYADSNTGYFEALEVKTIIALLKVIDNKLQDIPLLTVMRSPIGGFEADDMIQIRTKSKERAFFRAVLEYAKQQEDELSQRLRTFFDKIKRWQKAVRYLPMEDFIWKLYTESGYFAYAGAMPGGLQRQANLRLLLERARQFQKTSIRGLFHFIRFIDKLQSSSGDMGVAKTLGENENVLRIMSIHKSKGLEFPIVMVSGLGKKFNLSDSNTSVLFHKDLGLGPRYVNPETRQSCDTIAKSAMKQVIRLESLSEEMRILYVALTRAKNRLILLGSVRDLPKTAEKWAKPVSPYSLSKGINFLDWLGPVLMRHPDCVSLRNLLAEEFDQPLWNHDSKWQTRFHSRGDITAFHREEARNRYEFLTRLEHPEETIREILRKESKKSAAAGTAVIGEGPDAKYIGVEDSYEVNELDTVTEADRVSDLPAAGEADRLRNMIEERFSWVYPYRYTVNVPSKMTVTEVRKFEGLRGAERLQETEAVVPSYINPSPVLRSRPRFLEGSKRFTAAEKGTIVHFILQHLELDKAVMEEDVLQQVDDMVKKELLTEDEAKAADLSMIIAFLNSEIGRRIRNAPYVRRETPFNLRKKAHELMVDLQPGEDTLLIQGIIDCFFEEDGQWVLVDYKTDYVKSEDVLQQLIERYRTQMELYTEALVQITGKPVKERILYLLSMNQAVVV